ncbi:hypothetical protein [Mechercharimyces sp. CAU 1602]|uniref:hypothetical protein n=1 Tax=Mechercharimyces sp. CAU 1602 TaxID=2973933 RepID=UPI0021622432|nr:hypothetical protein [Mechercharimyces sp. CAU 1602]MCS1351686.1 hypothetical protein [Mechercharimyces sp. CAU 1602]
MKRLISVLSFMLFLVFAGIAPTYAAESEPKEASFKKLTYEEAVSRVSNFTGLSKSEVEEIYFKEDKEDKSLALMAASAACSYGEYSTKEDVAWNFKPTFAVIVKKCSSGSFGWLEDIKFAEFLSTNSKGFTGTIKAWVDDDKAMIEYVINGDFYDEATTTLTSSGGVNTPVFNASFSSSTSSNHYADYYSGLSYIEVVR